MKKLFVILFAICAMPLALDAATVTTAKPKGTSVLQSGTNVRAKVEPSGLFSQECYDSYYGCMDQFCMSDNADGGTCICSDDNQKFEDKMSKIQTQLTEANRIRTVEVEKIQAGAQADIIFHGGREYTADGNVLNVDKTNLDKKAQRKKDLLALWDEVSAEDEETFQSISDLTGTALYSSARELCLTQVPKACEKEINVLTQMYSTQIKSDCKAFENAVTKLQKSADDELAEAQKDVRDALKESFNEANEYDRGTCMVNFKKCMQEDDACGKDWMKCVRSIAAENMQNNKSGNPSATVEHIAKYEITDSTMEILSAKRNICEKVLNKCMAVRDMIWPDFLREAAPDIRLAELETESKFRQSCLTNISNCIQKACKDDIVGKGVDTMDACLSRPEMARQFCKVEIDPCERMTQVGEKGESLIWGYVKDKLAAMRVDRCTEEVKECFTSPDRCGDNFINCIGMDYKYMHDICPLDKLVVCKQDNPKFSMDDLDKMLMGFYLNADNAMLENCQNEIERKMLEVCGSTTDCDKFASDDVMGTASLQSQKIGNIYRLVGLISFGSIKMGDASGKITDKGEDKTTRLGPGEVGVQEYLTQLRATVKASKANIPDKEEIMTTIEAELNNIAGTINRTIKIIENDPKIAFCVNGRDLSQITGQAQKGKQPPMTSARFPNLLNQIKVQIAMSALARAQQNYNRVLRDKIQGATEGASADLAQFMCQRMAETGMGNANVGGITEVETPLTPPFAISYDVGAGLTTEQLMQGGSGVMRAGGVTVTGKKGFSASGGGITKTTNALFDRDSRTCKLCTTTISESCKTTGKKGWFKDTRGQECTTGEPVEKCEEMKM